MKLWQINHTNGNEVTEADSAEDALRIASQWGVKVLDVQPAETSEYALRGTASPEALPMTIAEVSPAVNEPDKDKHFTLSGIARFEKETTAALLCIASDGFRSWLPKSGIVRTDRKAGTVTVKGWLLARVKGERSLFATNGQ